MTGANYLFEAERAKILIDCGLFQGNKEFDDLNFKPFAYAPEEIDALFVTHAHVDHVGRIPKLVRDGFHGRIFSTAATRDLARLLLEDTMRLEQRENRELFNEEDLDRASELWEVLPYYEEVNIKGISVTLRNAGHILGSSFIVCRAEGRHIWFTGDLGNIPSALVPPPDVAQDVDYLIIESAYGNRAHESAGDRLLQLERAVEDVSSRRGTLMIPAFATERTQDILHELNEMFHYKRVPEMPVFVDAPLAIRITGVFEKYTDYYRQEIRDLYREHPNLFKFKRLKFTETVDESKAINDVHPPKVIIAGSGMMNGGRILHHVRRYLSDPNSILLIVGYQGAGSLGRRLIDGEEIVRIFGEDVIVRAEIRKISGFSAHADNPQLLSFVSATRDTLKKVFVVQGEEASALHLSQEIKDHLGVESEVPMLHESFEL
mgnify:CR=1 FL=1